MNKNFYIKTVFILIVSLLFFQFGCQKKTQTAGSTLWVDANPGLKLRKSPSLNGEVIILVPYGEEVKFIEKSRNQSQVDQTKDYWVKVKWKDKEGWLFNGYLSAKNPIVKSVESNKDDLTSLTGKFTLNYNKKDSGLEGQGAFSGEFYQYIDFNEDFTCSCRMNVCEGFITKPYKYKIIKGTIVVFSENSGDEFELVMLDDYRIKLVKNAGRFTCYNFKDTDEVILTR